LGEGLGAGRKRIRGWLAALGDDVAEVAVGGQPRLVLAADVAELGAAAAATGVRLLPGHDQWVLGPGTADHAVVPPARRQPVTRGADLVVAAGVVAGTWRVRDERLVVAWHPDAGEPDRDALGAEVARLAALRGRELAAAVEIA
jgi:hypothetical protein